MRRLSIIFYIMQLSKQKLSFLILFLIFLLSRVYILANPAYRPNDPKHSYSDVKQDYERYANMWYYGLTPYLEHYYEYPPATIPLVLTPLILDQKGIGKYYQNYRTQIFIIDILFFMMVMVTVYRQKQKHLAKIAALMFFIMAGVLAKDFYYEGIDLAFIASLGMAICLNYLIDQSKFMPRTLVWIFFWLSTAIKFMSLPLMLPLFLIRKMPLKNEVLALILGFLIVWGVPLGIFRSSLSVSIVFHLNRHMKFASLPYFITDTINKFTLSEVINNQPPDFNYVGPVSTQIEKVFSILMPIAIMAVLAWLVWHLLLTIDTKSRTTNKRLLLFIQNLPLKFNIDSLAYIIKTSLVYFLTLFLTGKVFSQPFHIWLIPLLALFPFKMIRKQLLLYGLCLWVIIIDTTQLIKFPAINIYGPFTLEFPRQLLRFIPMLVLLLLTFKLPINQDSHA